MTLFIHQRQRVMGALHVGREFVDFAAAKSAIVSFCQQNCHPIRHDKKETFQTGNKKFRAKNQFTNVPEDAIYSCRYH